MSLWSCPTCSKSFARKGDLTRHKLIHTGIKPHICEICRKGFRQFSGLKTHLNVHSKAKPHVCGIGTCTKAFGDPSSRTRHRKETHRREGAYKCIIPDCGTRIKRRSAFVAHLRKHGLDSNSIDLDAIAQQNNEKGISEPPRFASPDVEIKSHHKIKSLSVPPSSLGNNSGYCISGIGGEASRLPDNGGLSGDDLFDCRPANWSPTNDTLLLGSMLDQTVNSGPSGHPNDIYTYLSSNFENPFCFDDIFPASVDYPLLVASSSNLPAFEPFLGAGSDGSQSLWSSPSSTYSTLYTTNFNDDVVSLSLADDVLQEPRLYNSM